MSEAVSDAAVEILHVCRHSLRFAFGAPLGYPYAAAQFPRDNPPPALFRRVQVAWPPPDRDGQPWQTGLRIDDEPFEPDGAPERLDGVWAQDGASAFDQPESGTIVLDRWFSVPRTRQTMTFPGPDRDFTILSVPYWKAPETAQVDYFTTCRLDFTRVLDEKEHGIWIAISFDAFWPPERDSADVIARLGKCDKLCA